MILITKIEPCPEDQAPSAEVKHKIIQKFNLQSTLQDLSTDTCMYTVNALLSPRGAYLISDLPEGGLLERGALFTKSSDKDIKLNKWKIFGKFWNFV